jgi:hypothetical protein
MGGGGQESAPRTVRRTLARKCSRRQEQLLPPALACQASLASELTPPSCPASLTKVFQLLLPASRTRPAPFDAMTRIMMIPGRLSSSAGLLRVAAGSNRPPEAANTRRAARLAPVPLPQFKLVSNTGEKKPE